MNPKCIDSTLLLGCNFDYVLFKSAILFAESGLKVWFVSPETFDKIPENIVAPEKEILQLITFLYLKDYKDLISHLNGIHLWHKIPDVIILSNLEMYCNLYCDKYDSLVSALVVTTLIDSISVCAKKKQRAYLIVTCSKPPDNYTNRIQVLCDMYFPHVAYESEDKETLSKDIVDYYFNKNLSHQKSMQLISEKTSDYTASRCLLIVNKTSCILSVCKMLGNLVPGDTSDQKILIGPNMPRQMLLVSEIQGESTQNLMAFFWYENYKFDAEFNAICTGH